MAEQAGAVDRQLFPATRSELPLLYVLLALAAIELFVVHLVLIQISPVAAWILSALSALAILQIVVVIRRLKHRPTCVTASEIIIHPPAGGIVILPRNNVISVEAVAGSTPAGSETVNAWLLASPNIFLTTAPFVTRKFGRARRRTRVALRVDDPQALIDAVRRQSA